MVITGVLSKAKSFVSNLDQNDQSALIGAVTATFTTLILPVAAKVIKDRLDGDEEE